MLSINIIDSITRQIKLELYTVLVIIASRLGFITIANDITQNSKTKRINVSCVERSSILITKYFSRSAVINLFFSASLACLCLSSSAFSSFCFSAANSA